MKNILKTKKYIVLSLIFLPVVFGLFFSRNFSFAEENLAQTCDLVKVEESCKALSPSDCRVLLDKCEKYYQAESDKIENDISKTNAEKKTLQNKINSLSNKIKDLNFQIAKSNLVISDLKIQLTDTTKSIDDMSVKIDDTKVKLTDMVRAINIEDKKSLVEILTSDNLRLLLAAIADRGPINQLATTFLFVSFQPFKRSSA